MPLSNTPQKREVVPGNASTPDDIRFAQLLGQQDELGEIAREIARINRKFDEMSERLRAFLGK